MSPFSFSKSRMSPLCLSQKKAGTLASPALDIEIGMRASYAPDAEQETIYYLVLQCIDRHCQQIVNGQLGVAVGNPITTRSIAVRAPV